MSEPRPSGSRRVLGILAEVSAVGVVVSVVVGVSWVLTHCEVVVP